MDSHDTQQHAKSIKTSKKESEGMGSGQNIAKFKRVNDVREFWLYRNIIPTKAGILLFLYFLPGSLLSQG
jgi:hypothetical protein